MADKILHVGHSPDADDAFMFYAFAHDLVRVEGYRVTHVMEDIESLNRRAFQGELEVTAISAAVYPQVAARYRVMSAGASMGRDYGPIVVGKEAWHPEDLSGKSIAIPGRYTTAFLLLRLLVADFEPVEIAFDRIPQAVLEGEVDAGLLIHEGQVTYPEMGLQNIVDLGQWWYRETRLPLPLGLDVVRRDLGDELGRRIETALKESIACAFANEEAALAYAAQYSRGVDAQTCRKFVLMYVNDLTRDMGREGLQALEVLYERAARAGLVETPPVIDLF